MIENPLIRFRESFPLVKVIVYDNYLTYKVPDGRAKSCADLANELIDKLDLPLVAIPTEGYRGDSFLVKSSEVEL